MVAIRSMFAILFALALATAAQATSPQSKCRGGDVYYSVTFFNKLVGSRGRFHKLIPTSGLNFSPLSAAMHSPRFSFFTVGGFASSQVEQIAETGGNGRFLAYARAQSSVSSVVSGPPATPGKYQNVTVKASCAHPYVTALSMIAPSPDWIVQINNLSMLKPDGRFMHSRSGPLFAYDAGTDSGREFTSPSDASLDKPTEPPLNIALLSTDETDRFNGQAVGWYTVRRLYNRRN